MSPCLLQCSLLVSHPWLVISIVTGRNAAGKNHSPFISERKKRHQNCAINDTALRPVLFLYPSAAQIFHHHALNRFLGTITSPLFHRATCLTRLSLFLGNTRAIIQGNAGGRANRRILFNKLYVPLTVPMSDSAGTASWIREETQIAGENGTHNTYMD
jgi:hypothetical protein